ncbi:hypothetical protein B296_00056711, partial [Ensete ventricosum]
IILFSKGCRNPSFPFYATAVATAPMQAAAALARWQPHYQGAATPAAGATIPAGGRVGRPLRAPYSRHPLRAMCC